LLVVYSEALATPLHDERTRVSIFWNFQSKSVA